MPKKKTSAHVFANMFGMQKSKCCYCGVKMTTRNEAQGQTFALTDATIEHLLPKSRGGLDVHWNKKLACHRCNNCKGNMTSDEFWFLAGKCGSVETLLECIERARAIFKAENKIKFAVTEMFLHPDGWFKRINDNE